VTANKWAVKTQSCCLSQKYGGCLGEEFLLRVFELRLEMYYFFIDHPFYLSYCLVNTSWLQKLAYLADMFTKINERNLSCQGKSVSILTTRDRTASFRHKREL
jgi:hypothetical protein